MHRLLLVLLLAAPLAAFASTPAAAPAVEIDLSDEAALQRGASIFVNSCMGCHSAQYMRWNRVAEDIGVTQQQMAEYLQTTGDQPGDLMNIAMPAAPAEEWFGRTPPDLTLVARHRGVDWIYAFLHSFYLDDSKPTGVNNTVFPDTAMPHVLWQQQGLQRAVFREEAGPNGLPHQVFDHFEPVTEGSLDAEGYARAVTDVTTFLAYLAQPETVQRRGLGSMVILFLLFFFVFAYLLKREYWKDVH